MRRLAEGSGFRAAPASVIAAAAITAVVAIVMDVLAGEHPVHITTLGTVAVVVGLVRIRLAGGRHGLFAVVSGAIVAQPALHAATNVFPPAPGHLTQASLTLTQVVFTALVVAAVTGAQALLTALSSVAPAARLLIVPFRGPDTEGTARPESTSPASHTRNPFTACISRRGPPSRSVCAH